MKTTMITMVIASIGLIGVLQQTKAHKTEIKEDGCNYGQCSAIKSNGYQCGNCSQQGSYYCWSHR